MAILDLNITGDTEVSCSWCGAYRLVKEMIYWVQKPSTSEKKMHFCEASCMAGWATEQELESMVFKDAPKKEPMLQDFEEIEKAPAPPDEVRFTFADQRATQATPPLRATGGAQYYYYATNPTHQRDRQEQAMRQEMERERARYNRQMAQTLYNRTGADAFQWFEETAAVPDPIYNLTTTANGGNIPVPQDPEPLTDRDREEIDRLLRQIATPAVEAAVATPITPELYNALYNEARQQEEDTPF